MSKDKSGSKNDKTGPSNFFSGFFDSISRAACESTKQSPFDKCPHDVNVGGNVYDPGGKGDNYSGGEIRHGGD